ncbi:hypothetical protein B0J13DRAFT_619912 [Dactylonectria estremocensis]|uniref:Uncharacterized protein n=1 Tax=Dactylonectria estremocensis TaxID=1079267 RepID=A0A9P9F4V7_9HYPO|nr:hypothetical protein B0J13DRAFT_619912 [Dactylonectria estremocensis]
MNETGAVYNRVAIACGITDILQWQWNNNFAFDVSDGIYTAANRNCNISENATTLLLDKQRDKIDITEAVIKAAAANRKQGREILALLLNRHSVDIKGTEDVLETASAIMFRFLKSFSTQIDFPCAARARVQLLDLELSVAIFTPATIDYGGNRTVVMAGLLLRH